MFEGASLFVGALLDALIGPNLFVPGEPFLIAAGYQLHQGVITGVFAVLLGGLLGDQASYFIGRKVGLPAQKKLVKWQPKTRRPIARCRHLMAKRGNTVLVFARLLGPIAWVVPFMAGTHKVTWRRFSIFSSIGLVLGVGQFVMWGYLLAYGIDSLPIVAEVKAVIVEHQTSLMAVAASVIFLFIGKRLKWRLMLPKFSLFLLGSMLYANYTHFFHLSDDFAVQTGPAAKIAPTALNFKAYPGKSSVFDAQAINVLYFGESPRQLMSQLGWIENHTFSRHEIDPSVYLDLMNNQTPPVSDLFWNQTPQDMAFQLPGDWVQRSHIRWWKGGVDPQSNQTFWLGAISYDDGLTLTAYSGIVTVLHSVDPNVDEERDKLAQQVKLIRPQRTIAFEPLSVPTALDDQHDYFTDGQVLVIKEAMVAHAGK
ncbi:MAG: LssY C-terminal domain-containing protein [Vibrio sp.]|uniref:LssY C-terminal domain-containing protein n=1 Tax=Vibrio TaxID=662 RepID=UPI001EC8BB2C|nr:LssY C-terminal domain-containing protein [Vibrio sp.]NRB66439.1 LssY C-terminal domain-containing protein [Vibrio sp.]